MRRSDLTILLSLAAVGLLAAFWLLALSPKREEAAELGDQVSELEASVQEQEQLAAYARQAEEDFDHNYHRLVVLGKGVPADSETPSLLVQVQHLADETGIDFRVIKLVPGTQAEAPPATPPPLVAPGTQTDESSSEQPAQGTSTATTTAVPTEASAALLPLGASIGPAGLATMPYQLKFRGEFFEIADFLDELAGLVHPTSNRVTLSGRLLTVDGFSLSGDSDRGFPHLEANLSVTTYVTPAGQGLTAGATPAGPAPSSSTGTTGTTTSTATP